MNSLTHRIATVAVAGALSVTALGAPAASASDEVGPLACTATAPDKDASAYQYTFGDGVNIRKGRSTNCTVLGIAYSNQLADYHCWSAYDGYTWTYLRNAATGVTGWVRDDVLSDGGSSVWCGF